jgi:hypothetical protein
MKNIKDLLGTALPADLVDTLQEAFDTKVAEQVAESRKEVEEEIEANLARRFDRDRNQIIESIDSMISDALTEQEAARAEEMDKLTQARVQYHTAMVEGKKLIKNRLKESLSMGADIINKQLSEEITKLRDERAVLAERAEKMTNDLRSAKTKIAEQHAVHVQAIDAFVTKQLRAELVEFAEDKKALVEQRVKLVAEGRQKLKATQDRFIAEAAGKVEKFVEDNLKANLAELHEDLELNRQNMFGRRIFEAVVAEYMTSYFAEDTEVRKLQHVLESKETEIAEARAEAETAKQKLDEAKETSSMAERKARLAEDRAERSKITGELFANLKGEKRAVMENLLASTKTSELRKAFSKLLPVVLAESPRSATKTPVLSENKKVEKRAESRAVTGDAVRPNRLLENAEEETNAFSAEIDDIKRRAGLL